MAVEILLVSNFCSWNTFSFEAPNVHHYATSFSAIVAPSRITTSCRPSCKNYVVPEYAFSFLLNAFKEVTTLCGLVLRMHLWGLRMPCAKIDVVFPGLLIARLVF
jgi:hypothetical protein